MNKPKRKEPWGNKGEGLSLFHSGFNEAHDHWQKYHTAVLEKIIKHLSDLELEGDIALVNDRISWKSIIDMHKEET